ncbi:MAG: hypothetical protein JXB60_08655, partial [Candidatus Cloacimonetes bacterium]|nr:hypothetical protein [Candidatus Cloacimonadota bacterium]
YVKNDQTGCNQIYKVPADGGEQVTLTTLTLDHWYPQWSPDGEWIVYQMVFGGGSWQIYIVSSTPAGIDDQTIIPVAEYNLSNFPNPFNPNTEILFSMPAPGMVSLLIHNIKGQLVRALVENQHVKGDYHYLWDGADNYGNCVDAGLYFYTLIVNGRTAAANRLLLIK